MSDGRPFNSLTDCQCNETDRYLTVNPIINWFQETETISDESVSSETAVRSPDCQLYSSLMVTNPRTVLKVSLLQKFPWIVKKCNTSKVSRC